MQPSEQPDEQAPAEDSDFLEEYINAEATQDLEERQDVDQVGRRALRRRVRERTGISPKLTGGDIDTAWDLADDDEETIGGATPTPDQDVVDAIGEGAGLTYQDDEPLNYAKVLDRDQHRWELNPASAAEADGDEPDEADEDELDELAALDGELEETEGTELLDVDDLAEELDDEAEADDLEDDYEDEEEDEDDGEQ